MRDIAMSRSDIRKDKWDKVPRENYIFSSLFAGRRLIYIIIFKNQIII